MADEPIDFLPQVLCHAVEKDVVVIVSHKSQGGMTHAPSITRYFALHQGGDTISRNR